MNFIICLSQDSTHWKIQAGVYSSVVYMFSNVLDLSLPTLSSYRKSKKILELKKTKFQRIFEDLINCGSPNQKLLK